MGLKTKMETAMTTKKGVKCLICKSEESRSRSRKTKRGWACERCIEKGREVVEERQRLRDNIGG